MYMYLSERHKYNVMHSNADMLRRELGKSSFQITIQELNTVVAGFLWTTSFRCVHKTKVLGKNNCLIYPIHNLNAPPIHFIAYCDLDTSFKSQ